MSILGNYIELKPGVAKKMKISGYIFSNVEIIDPDTKEQKTIRTLNCRVVREDDQEVNKTFSITSEKLAQALFPFLEKGHHLDKEVVITQSGRGYMKEYTVAWL